jgi:hypothetical protein
VIDAAVLSLLRPGAVLGLPEGFPDPVYHLGVFRYLLFGLTLAWAAAVARARKGLAVVIAALYVAVAVGFWAVTLERPYGLFLDADTTRRAAAVSVAASGGGSFLAGEPAERALWPVLARSGVPPGALILGPTFLPPLALLASALLILALRTPRERGWLESLFWIAFSTGDLDAIRGFGLVPAAWAHPEGTLLFLVVAAGVLVLGRFLRGRPTIWPIAALPCLAIALAPAGSGHGPGELLLALTFDQGLWLPLALWGLVRDRDPVPRALVLGGAVVTVVSAFGLPFDAWTALAVYRLGVVLAAAAPVARACEAIGQRLSGRGAAPFAPSSAALGCGAFLAVAVSASLPVWIDPLRQDPIAEASREPLSPSIVKAMAHVRDATPSDAVVAASPEYAPFVAVLAGRRVLRAPTLASAADEERRERAERLVLLGESEAPVVRRYGVSHVFVAPGDFRAYGLRAADELSAVARLRLVLTTEFGGRLYEVRPSPDR